MSAAATPGSAAGPSRTSQAVALLRAGMARPSSPGGDRDAQRRLCAGMAPAPAGPLRAELTARTRFFDGQVMAAIAARVGQVVVLGAGYDDRALRFRSPGTAFFEVDQPSTQADKARRLRACGAGPADVTLAAADFRRDDIGAVLAGAGHDAAAPTLFLAEGLLVYLDQPAIARLLAGLRARAAAGSRLTASLAVHRADVRTEHVLAVANGRRPSASAEPWLTILPAADHLRLVAEAGWRIAGATDTARLAAAVRPGRSLLITAAPAAAGRRDAGSG